MGFAAIEWGLVISDSFAVNCFGFGLRVEVFGLRVKVFCKLHFSVVVARINWQSY
jgi:hypothetical protein